MTVVGRQSTAGGTGVLARVAPLRQRLRTEAGSAGLLLAATVVALLWANSPVGDSYNAFWHTELAVQVGGAELAAGLLCGRDLLTADHDPATLGRVTLTIVDGDVVFDADGWPVSCPPEIGMGWDSQA